MQGDSRNLFKKSRLSSWAQIIWADAYISQVSFLALNLFCSDMLCQEPCQCPKDVWRTYYFWVAPFLPAHATLYLLFSTAPLTSEECRSLWGSSSSCLLGAGAKDDQFLNYLCQHFFEIQCILTFMPYYLASKNEKVSEYI